jgi:hypothetical protein
MRTPVKGKTRQQPNSPPVSMLGLGRIGGIVLHLITGEAQLGLQMIRMMPSSESDDSGAIHFVRLTRRSLL